MKRKQILENVCMQSLMWGIVMNVFCLLIYRHLLVFFLLAGKKYVYNPADDSPPDTLVFLPLLPQPWKPGQYFDYGPRSLASKT